MDVDEERLEVPMRSVQAVRLEGGENENGTENGAQRRSLQRVRWSSEISEIPADFVVPRRSPGRVRKGGELEITPTPPSRSGRLRENTVDEGMVRIPVNRIDEPQSSDNSEVDKSPTLPKRSPARARRGSEAEASPSIPIPKRSPQRLRGSSDVAETSIVPLQPPAPATIDLAPLLKATEKEEPVPKRSLAKIRADSEADRTIRIPIPPKSPRRLMGMWNGAGAGGVVMPERSPKGKGRRAEVV